MLTKIVVEKTYWVGMTEKQKQDLINFLGLMGSTDAAGDTYSDTINETLNNLRQSLLNV